MILVLGGLYQGKTKYVVEEFPNLTICEASEHIEDLCEYDIILNIDFLVHELLMQGINVRDFFESKKEQLKDKIITGNEIGLGIVPIEKMDRLLRDEVGFLYQELVRSSVKVIRMWNGIPIVLKGE